MRSNNKILDRISSLESLLEAGLSEIRKTRTMIQGGVSTPPTGQNRVDIIQASKQAVSKRNQFIKQKRSV